MEGKDLTRDQDCFLKEDHQNYCLFIKPQDGQSNFYTQTQDNKYDNNSFESNGQYIFIEAFHPRYQETHDFLIKIAEPVNKPKFIHVYKMTLFSMYTAMSLDLTASIIQRRLLQYCKNQQLPASTIRYIEKHTNKFGSAFLYMYEQSYYLKIDQEQLRNAISDYDSLMDEVEYFPQENEMENHNLNQTQQYLNEDQREINQNQCKWNFKKFKIKLNENLFQVTKKIIDQHIPLINEYDFENDKLKKLNISLKQITQPRIYQQRALENIFISGKARSGIVVLPCGAGKTLLGIIVAEKIKRSTLVICDIDTATKQWKTEFLRWTNIKEDKIVIRTGQRKDEIPQNGEPFILITTYKQLTSVMNRVNNQKKSNVIKTQFDEMDKDVTDIIHKQQWGLCIADETQMSAAETYKEIFKEFKFKLKIGLTATPYREDNKITDLFHMIGPKLYEVNISELIQDGHLAKPYCVLFRVKMAEKARQLVEENPLYDVVAYTGNQKKFKLLAYLIKLHELRGDKILVFCDSIAVLEEFSKRLCYPVICGNVKKLDEKLAWLDMFRKGYISTLFLSRVGDTALDLPSANVCIQIGFHFGSRKQEVQRLGRIMRRKEGQKGEYNAYFYTIISKDTKQAQIYYHRQKCLVDLGLDFEVIDEDKFEYDKEVLDPQLQQLCNVMEQEDKYLRSAADDD